MILSETPLAEFLDASIRRPAADPARIPDPGDDLLRGDPENGPFYSAARGRVVLDVGITRILGSEILGRGEITFLASSQEQADHLISGLLHE